MFLFTNNAVSFQNTALTRKTLTDNVNYPSLRLVMMNL